MGCLVGGQVSEQPSVVDESAGLGEEAVLESGCRHLDAPVHLSGWQHGEGRVSGKSGVVLLALRIRHTVVTSLMQGRESLMIISAVPEPDSDDVGWAALNGSPVEDSKCRRSF